MKCRLARKARYDFSSSYVNLDTLELFKNIAECPERAKDHSPGCNPGSTPTTILRSEGTIETVSYSSRTILHFHRPSGTCSMCDSALPGLQPGLGSLIPPRSHMDQKQSIRFHVRCLNRQLL